MRTFGGEFARKQKVSLSGKSRQAESRDVILEKARREREKRQQLKIESQAAQKIQAAWRSYLCLRTARDAMRSQWNDLYGTSGFSGMQCETGHADGNTLDGERVCFGLYLQQLCFFADSKSMEDVELIADACHSLKNLYSSNVERLKALAQSANRTTPMLTDEDLEMAGIRARKMVSIALDGLCYHRKNLKYELWEAKDSLCRKTNVSQIRSGIAGMLVDCIRYLTSDEHWTVSPERTQISRKITSKIIFSLTLPCPGLFEKLALIVLEAYNNSSTDEIEPKRLEEENNARLPKENVAAGEKLITHMVVQFFLAQIDIKLAQLSFHSTEKRNGCNSQPLSLFFVPSLVNKIPSLKPVIARLWHCTIIQWNSRFFNGLLEFVVHRTEKIKSKMDLIINILGNLVDFAEDGFKYKPSIGESDKWTVNFVETNCYGTVSICAGFVDAVLELLSYVLNERLIHRSETIPASSSVIMDDDTDDIEEEDQAILSGIRERREMRRSRMAQDSLKFCADQDTKMTCQDELSSMQYEQLQVCLRKLSEQALTCAIIRGVLFANSVQSSPNFQDNKVQNLVSSATRKVCTYILLLMQLTEKRHEILFTLAFGSEFIPRLWFSFLRPSHLQSQWEPSVDDLTLDPGWILPLSIYSEVFTAAIIVSGDQGLYERQNIIKLNELPTVISLLRQALWHILWVEVAPSPHGWSVPAKALRDRFSRSAGRLMGQLHERNGRRQFTLPEVFYAENLPLERFHAEVTSGVAVGLDVENPEGSRAWKILRHAPFLVPFVARARVFQQLVSTERSQYRDSNMMSQLFGGGHRFLTIQRGNALSDAYVSLGSESPEVFKGRIRVAFVSELGTAEAGVDGGGIFKEFLEEVVKEGFETSFGLFLATTDQRLYPNPHAKEINDKALELLEFLGKLLGKALWEGILVELPLAWFFLKKFLKGGTCDIDDLPSLDSQLTRSLLSLRDLSPEEVESLGLTFSVSDSVQGEIREIELIPGGRQVSVTSSNALGFIHAVSDFRLNRQLQTTTAAFLRGFHMLIPRQWLSMFNAKELQELISGAADGSSLDITDMQANVQYAGGYSPEHPVIKAFWKTLESFNAEQQSKFLRFVTSCPRPPLLGFAYLEPPMCIQMAGSEEGNTERLPTAATCMNLLKLPPYQGGVEQLKEKLLYSIESGAGFELS